MATAESPGAMPEIGTFRFPAPLAVEQASRPAHILLGSGVDPDAKMPDNSREFGPRDRLVRVRCPGQLPNSCRHRIALSLSMLPWHPAGAAAKPPRPARTTGPDDGERELYRGRGARAADAGCVPQARIVRCCSTTESEPPDGTHGNFLTTGVSQQEPHDGKGNDSGKSAANRRNPVLFRSHRQQLRPWPRSGRKRRDSPADRQPVTADDRALIRRDFTAIAAQPRAGCANRGKSRACGRWRLFLKIPMRRHE